MVAYSSDNELSKFASYRSLNRFFVPQELWLFACEFDINYQYQKIITSWFRRQKLHDFKDLKAYNSFN